MVTPVSPLDPLAIQEITNVLYVDPTQPNAPVSGSGYFGDAMQTYFGGLNAAQQQAIWLNFLNINDLSDPPPSTPQNQQLFQQYVTSTYTQLEYDVISSDTTAPLNISAFFPPPGSFFDQVMQQAFPATSFTPLQQQQLWVQFLIDNNYTTTPPVDDANTRSLFAKYLELVLINNTDYGVAISSSLLPNLQPHGALADAFSAFNSVLIPDPTNNNTPTALSPFQLQQLWAQFVFEQNIDITKPVPFNSATINAMNNFVTQITENMIVSQGAYSTLGAVSVPQSGVIGDIMKAYFGGYSAQYQQQVWVQYLLNNNPPGVTTVSTDPATLEGLLNYCNTVITPILGQLSPDEIKKREIMTDTFNILLEMLDQLQESIAVQSQDLIFYGNWQEAYTTMMTGVPTYVGTPADAVEAPSTVNSSTDYTKFTFGYNNISVADIANWWASNSLNNVNQPFTMSSGASITVVTPTTQDVIETVPEFQLTFTPQSGQTAGSISWTVNTPGTNAIVSLITNPAVGELSRNSTIVTALGTPLTQTVSITQQQAVSTFYPSVASTNSSPLQAATNAYVTAFEGAFAQAWNSPGSTGLQSALNSVNTANLGVINAAPTATEGQQDSRSSPDGSSYSALEIPWAYGYVAASNVSTTSPAGILSTSDSKSRAEVNTRDQAYIENIRSQRQTIQGFAQEFQDNLDNSNQAISNQSDLLTSVLQSIQDIVQSIFT